MIWRNSLLTNYMKSSTHYLGKDYSICAKHFKLHKRTPNMWGIAARLFGRPTPYLTIGGWDTIELLQKWVRSRVRKKAAVYLCRRTGRSRSTGLRKGKLIGNPIGWRSKNFGRLCPIDSPVRTHRLPGLSAHQADKLGNRTVLTSTTQPLETKSTAY